MSWIFYLFMIFHVFQGYLYQSFPHSCWFRWYICEHWSGFTTKGEFKVFPKVLQVLDKKKFQFKLSFHSSKEVCLQVYHVYVSSLFVCRFFIYDSYINDVSVLRNLYDALIIKMLNICMIILLSLKYMLWQIFFTRPMSGDRNTNTVDPRTYFYLREFLEKFKSAGETIVLIPTWVRFFFKC